MKDIQKIFRMLDYRNPYDVQLQGYKLAKELKDISPLVQPAAAVNIWEACADILYEKTDGILEPHLEKLIEWIIDLNWPGAKVILNRLKVFSGEKLRNTFIKYVEESINLNNEEGLMQLDSLSELLDN